MFGHIGVRAKSSTIVNMVDTALKVIVDPDYNIRVCFRSVTKQYHSNFFFLSGIPLTLNNILH